MVGGLLWSAAVLRCGRREVGVQISYKFGAEIDLWWAWTVQGGGYGMNAYPEEGGYDYWNDYNGYYFDGRACPDGLPVSLLPAF